MPGHQNPTSEHKHKHKHRSQAPSVNAQHSPPAGAPAGQSGSPPARQANAGNRRHHHHHKHKHRRRTPQAPSQPPLSEEEKTQLVEVRKSLVGRKAREIEAAGAGAWTLTDAQRSNPEAEGQRKRDKAARGAARADALYSGGIMDVGVPGVDAASGYVDYAGGGDARNWGMLNEKNEAWGDGTMQNEGIPIASAVAKSVKSIIQAGKYIKQMVDFHRARTDEESQSTGESAVATEEKWEVFSQTADIVQNLLDTAMSWVGAFTTVMGRIPIVGAVFGAVNAGMSFVMDAIQWGKSAHYLNQMQEQKAKVKTQIQGEKSVFGAQVGDVGGMEQRRKGRLRREKVEKFKVKRFYGTKTDEDTGKERLMRLDEKTQALRASVNASGSTLSKEEKAEREKAIRDMEDYDVLKELASANKKRRREGITNLIFKDATNFATALAGLDPTGLGSGIGASINAVVGLGYAGKAAATFVRQKLRNHGAGGADLNKSDANKRQRRHNLAVVLYDRIMALAGTKAASIENPDTASQEQLAAVHGGALGEFEQMNDRIGALGVAGAFLRAHSAPEMVSVMRQGFYRESGG